MVTPLTDFSNVNERSREENHLPEISDTEKAKVRENVQEKRKNLTEDCNDGGEFS